MVYVPWEQYGICKFWAMQRNCNFGDGCRRSHPPDDEVRRIWNDHEAAEQTPMPSRENRHGYGLIEERPRVSLPPRPQPPPPPPPGLPPGYAQYDSGHEGPGYPPNQRINYYSPGYQYGGIARYDWQPHGTDRVDMPPGDDPFSRKRPWADDLMDESRRPRSPTERHMHGLPHSTTMPFFADKHHAQRPMCDTPARSYKSSTPPAADHINPNTDAYALPPGFDPRTGQPLRPRFDPALSSNAFVNGSLIYRFVWGDPLCVRCGTTGHLPKQCQNNALSEIEQDYLFKLMRAEQNRSKAEKGLDVRQSTHSLRPTPEGTGSRPTRRDGSVLSHSSMRDVPTLDGHASPRGGYRAGDDNRISWGRRDPHDSDRGFSPRAWKPRRSPPPGYGQVSYREEYRAQRRPSSAMWEGQETAQVHEDRKRMIDAANTPGRQDMGKRSKEKKSGVKRKDGSVKSEEEGQVRDRDRFSHPSYLTVSAPPEIKSQKAAAGVDLSTPGKASVPPEKSKNKKKLEKVKMGATKRMSNGEAKVIGPHPSTIRVSAPYITQSAVEKRLQPSGLDSQETSLAEAREDTARLQGVAWLDNVRRALQLPVKTYTTACVYYHKFRLANQEERHITAWTEPAAASLLTSCKNEDTLKKSRDILAAAYNMKLANTHEHAGTDDPIFEQQSRYVISAERMILEAGGFDFRSRSPHHVLVKIGKSLPKSDELKAVTKLAWTILTDLHRTFAPLKQTSSTLALASLELAAHFKAADSQNNTCVVRDHLQQLDSLKWHSTREEIMETLLDALDLYTHRTSTTILGPKYALEDMLRIRLQLNKECSDSSLPRYTVVQPPPSPDNTNGTSSTLRVANGHPTPVSPPQPGTQAPPPQPTSAVNTQTTPDAGTLRFMLDPQRATDERAEVKRYFTEEWEEYEEQIEVPLPRGHGSDRDRDRDRRRDHPSSRDTRYRDRHTSRDVDDRRGARDSPRGPAADRERRPVKERDAERESLRERERDAERESLRERERDAERERTRLRDRDRERRPYDDDRSRGDRSDRDRDRYDKRDRERDGDRRRQHYDDDRRRDRR